MMMKKTILLLATAMLTWTLLPAQSAKSGDEGYLFVSPLKSHSKKSLKSPVESTIEAGRVAVKSNESGELAFSLIDVAESMTLGSGSFYEYFPPAQDYVPAEFVSVAEFKKATRKVRIYSEVPASIECGKRYVFKPQYPSEYRTSATIRVIRLTGKGVTLVTDVDHENDFTPSRTEDISGKALIEVSFGDNIIYLYNGQPLMLASNLGGRDYSTLEVDANGATYAKDEDGNRQATTKLSYVFGEIPEIGYFGWISDTELVIDDELFILATH